MKRLATIGLLFFLILSSSYVWAEEINTELEAEKILRDFEVEGQEITEIEIEGNWYFSNQEILAMIETEVGTIIDRDKLQNDLESLFDLGYFMNLETSFVSYENGVKIILKVVDNPYINEVIFRGNQNLKDAELKELLGVKSRNILNINELNQGLEEIIKGYDEQGYVLVDIEEMRLTEDDSLEIKIDEGRINNIIIRGNDKTEEPIIRRELTIAAGDVLNTDRLWQNIMVLNNLDYIKQAIPNIDTSEDDLEGTNLVINIEEAKSRSYNLGGGYGSNTDVYGAISFQENNFLGKGQQIRAGGKIAQELMQVELNFKDSKIFASDIGGEIDLNWQQGARIKGVAEDRYGEEFFGRVNLDYSLTPTTKGYLQLDMQRLYNYVNKTDYQDKFHQYQDDLWALALGVISDSRDDHLKPNEGGRYQLALQAGEVIDDENFYKGIVTTQNYFPVADEHTLAIKLNAKVGTSNDRGITKYYLRDTEKLPGYNSEFRRENPARFVGDSMWLGRIEYRHNFTNVLTVGPFLTAGRTFKELEFETDDINYSLGLASEVKTRFGLLNLEYAYALDIESGEFNISLGPEF